VKVEYAASSKIDFSLDKSESRIGFIFSRQFNTYIAFLFKFIVLLVLIAKLKSTWLRETSFHMLKVTTVIS